MGFREFVLHRYNYSRMNTGTGSSFIRFSFPFDDAQCYLHIFNIFADGFMHENHIYISYYKIISRVGYSRIEIQT